MTRHSTAMRLQHMLDYAREAYEMTRSITRQDLDNDRRLNLAVVRLLEVLGEAAAKVPPEEREKLTGIPWFEIVGLRNRLIHGYDEVNLSMIWEIVQNDLPVLIAELEKVV